MMEEMNAAAGQRNLWKAQKFHADNPHVYSELVSLARQLRGLGHERYSIKGLWEVLRHRRAMQTNASDFKLNNNYTAHYARWIMDREPDLSGFFATRTTRTT